MMKHFFLLMFVIFESSILVSQNVGINTTNPQEQLHIRSDSTKIALRLDTKKTAAGGFDFFTVTGTPSEAQNFEFSQYHQNWTDLGHNKLIQSDDNRLNSPFLSFSQYSNILRVHFAMQSTIPSNAVITDVTLHAEMRRNGNFDGSMNISYIGLTKASNLQPLSVFGYHNLSNTTDLTFSFSQQQVFTPITVNMLNQSDFFIAIGLTSYVSGLSRLEIDRLWLEVEYKLPAQGTPNVYWTTGTQDGTFKITNSTNLNSNQYLTIDETGITQLKGLKISKNAGSGKVLTSNDEGKAFWSSLPDPEFETLWINKNDTAFYNNGAVQINNNTGESAIIFDKGDSRINNDNNMLETNRRLIHVTLDADNNQANEMFSIYKDSTLHLGQNPAVRFHLDGDHSWINTGGNVGIGTDNIHPSAQLQISSVNKGILIPRMTTAQKLAISPNVNGLMVFDTDIQQFSYFSNSEWIAISETIWTQNQDTAFYNIGPIKIDNTVNSPALIFDKGNSRLNNGINMLETDNRLLNVILDADNDQVNEQFNIYKDDTQLLAENPAVRFHLDGGNSWINTGGSFIVGSDILPLATATSDTLMFFDRSKAAFRVGRLSGSNSWAPDNIGIGSFASGVDTKASGDFSTAMGYNTVASDDYSTSIGNQSIASGYNSTALGVATIASGNQSTALGSGTEASGTWATAIGNGSVASGQNSTSFGVVTLANGVSSTAMGAFTEASGNSSTAMGSQTTASGHSSTSIGNNTKAKGFASTVIGIYNDSILTVNEIAISPTTPLFIVGNGDNTIRTNAMVINKNGRVGLGLNLPGHPIHHSNGARLTAAGDWTNASDRRLKSQIQPINYGLKELMQLQPSTYTVNATGEKHIGFIAQDLKKIIPEVVSGTEGDMKNGETLGVSYGNMVALLTKAIQEQQVLIEDLRSKVGQIDELEARIKSLEQMSRSSNAQGGKD